ncbi:MAG: dihydroorotate dehydrogenase (quinone) [Alteromonadaceae bacterium]|nr:MAG: dihydroorotate dehydrogenase (quinone) [Alteromonadaceae bacterium]
MYAIARNLLFCLPPEVSHDVSLDLMGAGERLGLLKFFSPTIDCAPVEVMGLRFPNAVGLAAGLDKNGDYFNALGQLGFGFVEIGTVTPLAQTGNPQPRLFRLKDEKAIINRMGFNNKGVQHLVENAKQRRYRGVLGINIGKNKATPEDEALSDYEQCMDAVYPYADYISVNVSSPNTPGLRDLQFGEQFTSLLAGIKVKQKALSETHGKYVPVAVKIAPDMSDEEIQSVAQSLLDHAIDAVIATNTTVSRELVPNSCHRDEMGGLSGAPLVESSTHVISVLSEALKGQIPIIGVGGIMSAADAEEKIEAGASLVQIYSGFIYEGPSLIKEAAEAISALG